MAESKMNDGKNGQVWELVYVAEMEVYKPNELLQWIDVCHNKYNRTPVINVRNPPPELVAELVQCINEEYLICKSLEDFDKWDSSIYSGYIFVKSLQSLWPCNDNTTTVDYEKFKIFASIILKDAGNVHHPKIPKNVKRVIISTENCICAMLKWKSVIVNAPRTLEEYLHKEVLKTVYGIIIQTCYEVRIGLPLPDHSELCKLSSGFGLLPDVSAKLI